MFPAKVAQDVERHLLSTTVKLSDGTSGQVFSRSSSTNSSGIYSYNCHLCGVANLLGERCLQTHISGRKHQTKFAQPIIDAEQFRTPLFKRAQIQMAIAPGEPVPPGFENEVKPMAQIQSRLDKIKDEAIVGLEYLMELTMGIGKEPSYHCVICDKRGDPRTIIVHLTSYNHQLKYLEKHFPTVVREIATFRFNKDARDVMPKVLRSICEAIEDTHGRLTPNVYENNNYIKNRMKYFQEAIIDRHFDEKMGSTFVNVVDKKVIQDAVNSGDTSDIKTRTRDPSPPHVAAPKRVKPRQERKSLDSISSISSSSIGDKSPPRSNERRLIGTIDLRSRSRSSSFGSSRRRKSKSKSPKGRGRSPIKRLKRSPERQLPPTPRELAIQSCEIAKEGYKWEKYRCMVELALPELDKLLKDHEKNPEKHPMYPEEWKKFWNKRYKELQAEKKDPAKHDFKPEWIQFWTRRMHELHDEEVKKKKAEIRKKLNLPEDGKERTDELKQQYIMKVKTTERSKSRERPPPRRRSNDKELSSASSKRERSRERPRKRTPSPEEDRYRSSKHRRSKSPVPRKSSYPREMEHVSSRTYLREPIPPPKEYYRYEARDRYDEWARPAYYAPVKPPPSYYYSESAYPPKSPPKYEEEDNEPLTVVSVLRLLTALEELLGSLGPKVNDLLARALALEKVKANSADDMLINEDTCVIFETIKEKLKGQLIAGVLEKNKVNAVKKAIKNVAAVIHEVTEKAKTKSKEESTKTSAESAKPPDVLKAPVVPAALAVPAALSVPTPVAIPMAAPAALTPPSIDNKEKQMIAQKIATALVVQGKTDVTEEQLEQLINVYIQMQQKAKESNKSLSTATYLEETSKSAAPTVVTPVAPQNVANEETLRTAKEITQKESDVEKRDDELPADASSALESLTDSDLQTLLQNFKDLSAEEQQHLIAYLKKLEANHPTRVEKLRKFVNVDVLRGNDRHDDRDDEPEEDEKPMNKIIIPTQCKEPKPLASKYTAERFSDEEDGSFRRKFVDSDDDDDYSYDDVFRAASKNVKEKQLQDALRQDIEDEGSNVSRASSNADSTSTQNLNISIADTQNLIANIMGSLQKNAQNQQSSSKSFIDSFSPVNDDGSSSQGKFSQPPPLSSQNKSYSMQSHSLTNVPLTTQQQQQQLQQQSSSMQQLPQIAQIQLKLPHQQQNSLSQQSQQQQQNRYPTSNVPFYQQQSTFYQESGYGNKQPNTFGFNGVPQNGSGYFQGYGQGYNETMPSTYPQDYSNSNSLLYSNLGYAQNNQSVQSVYPNFAQQTSGQQIRAAHVGQQQIRSQQQSNSQTTIQQQQQQQTQPQQQQQQQRQLNPSIRPLLQQNQTQPTPQTHSNQQQPRPMIPHQVQQKQIRPNQPQPQQQRYGGNQFNNYY